MDLKGTTSVVDSKRQKGTVSNAFSTMSKKEPVANETKTGRFLSTVPKQRLQN